MVIVDDEVTAVVLNLSSCVRYSETLVAVQQNGVRCLPAEELPMAVALWCGIAEGDIRFKNCTYDEIFNIT